MKVKFVCTNRARHRPIELRKSKSLGAFWSEDGDWLGGFSPGELGRQTVNGRTMMSPLMELRQDGGVELLCPKCGRNPQLSLEKLNVLRTAGITEVDISRLPF